MKVDGYCTKCGSSFDAHWSLFTNAEGVVDYHCIYCKATEVIIESDEHNNTEENYDDDED